MKPGSGWHRKRTDTPAARARAVQYASPEYRQLRGSWALHVAAGLVCCWRCRRPIPPGSDWHLGHDDGDRRVIRGPEHPACNLRSAARKGAAVRKGKRSPIALEQQPTTAVRL